MRKENVFRRFIALILVICLTATNFIFATTNIVLALSNIIELENGNVVFETYFKDGDEKVTEKTAKISEGGNLYFGINVKAGKIQNAKIKIEDANFKIVKNKVNNKYVSDINEKTNEIFLREIGYNDEFIEIELPITFEENSKIDMSYFEKDNKISLSGVYVNDENGENIQSEQITTKLKWEEDETELNYNANIEKIMFADNKMVVQTEISSKYSKNYFPKENETLTIDLPTINDITPEYMILVDGEKVNSDDIYIDTENGTISYTKQFVENNCVSWLKDGNVYKVIYIYDGITSLSDSINLKTLIETKICNNEEILSKTLNLSADETKGTIASVTAKSISEGLYKGYMYGNLNETIYNELYNVELSYAGDFTATLNLIEDKFNTKEDKSIVITNGTEYKEIKINKERLANILGENGKLEIKPKNSELDKIEIDRNNLSDYDEEILIEYEKIKNSHNVEIKIINPENEGIIGFDVTKAIKGNAGLDKEDIEKIKSIETTVGVSMNKESSDSIATVVTELKDTKKDATLTMNNNNVLSTTSENNVEFIATLKTGTMENDLIKSPTIKIVLPNEVKTAQITSVSALYAEQKLNVVSSEVVDDNKALLIKLDGEQVSYNNKFVDGIKININAKITLNDMSVSRDTTIDMEYTNENSSSEPFKTSTNVQVKAPYGLIRKSVLKAEFENANKGIQTVTFKFVNNHEKEIENLAIIGSMPESIIDEEKLTVQYSDDKENWTSNKENAKYIKIDVKNANGENKLAVGEQIADSYKFSVKSMLPDYQVIYTIDEEVQIHDLKFDKVTSNLNDFIQNSNDIPENEVIRVGSQENSETETNENTNVNTNTNTNTSDNTEPLKVTMHATSGNDEVKNGDEVYEGQVIRYTYTIMNNSDKEITDLKLVANHENANVYEYTTHQQPNTAKPNETLNFTFEEEKQKSDISFDIGTLESGKFKKITYQIRVREDIENVNSEVAVSGTDIEDIKFESTNNVKHADLSLNINNFIAKENIVAKDQLVSSTFSIKNTSHEKLENVVVGFNIPKEFKYFDIEQADNYKIVQKDDNYLRFSVDELAPGASKDIEVTIQMNESKVEKQNAVLQYYAEVNGVTYYSNQLIVNLADKKESKIVASLSSNIKDIVKTGDKLVYTIAIKNIGTTDESLIVRDEVPKAAVIKNVYYKIGETEKKIEDISFNSVGTIIDLKSKEEVKIYIETEVDESLDGSVEMKNYASIVGNLLVETVKTNEITHKLKSNMEEEKKIEETSNEDKESSNKDNNQNNKDKDSSNTKQDNNSNVDKTSNVRLGISGVAWEDKNKNGKRDSDENTLEGITVLLGNIETGEYVEDDNGNKLEVTTDENGKYSFDYLTKGKYIVIFRYDNVKYRNTEYRVKNIDEKVNSDIITSKLSKNNDEIKYGITDTLELKDKALENIDAGFIENEVFDLSLNKYISKIIVEKTDGKVESIFKKEKLAKIEIDAKKLYNSNVTIEYELEVKNEGEIAGFVNELVDYLPKDLTFIASLNKDWYLAKDGTLHTTILSDELINPGETKTVKLILQKELTNNNTGLTTNKAEITKSSNELAIPDKDLNEGSQTSIAETIISIRTGRGIAIGMLMFVIGLGLLMVYIYIRKERR